MIKQIIDKYNNILAIIINDHPNETTFVTDSTYIQQVGYIVLKQGDTIQKHYHAPIVKTVVGLSEVLYVQSGKCIVHFYDQNQEFVTDLEIVSGNLLVIIAGGHGFTMLEDTVLIETKNGPYLGDSERIRF